MVRQIIDNAQTETWMNENSKKCPRCGSQIEVCYKGNNSLQSMMTLQICDTTIVNNYKISGRKL